MIYSLMYHNSNHYDIMIITIILCFGIWLITLLGGFMGGWEAIICTNTEVNTSRFQTCLCRRSTFSNIFGITRQMFQHRGASLRKVWRHVWLYA